MERRVLLRGLGTASASAVAGCLGTVGDDSADVGGDYGAGDGREDASPADAVEGYFRALADGDREAANEFANPDGPYFVDDDDHRFLEVRNLTIDGAETVGLEAAVRPYVSDPEEMLADFVEQEEAARDALIDEHGFDDYAYVRHSADADGFSFNSVLTVFEDEGEWLVWSPTTGYVGGA